MRRSGCTDGIRDAAVGEKRKNVVQSKTTSLIVDCNSSPKHEDYFLSMLKKWLSHHVPLYWKENSLTHCVSLTMFITKVNSVKNSKIIHGPKRFGKISK